MTFTTLKGYDVEVGSSGVVITFTATHGATIVSLGWTTQGNASLLTIPQLVVYNNGVNARIQFVNSGPTVAIVNAHAVLALPDRGIDSTAILHVLKQEVTEASQD